MSPPRALVVWQAGVDWDGLAGTDRHLVTRLTDDVDVLWVDPPRSVIRVFRRRSWGDLRVHTKGLAPGLSRLTPVAPPLPFRPGMAGLTDRITRRSIRRAVRALGRDVACVVTTSPHPDLDVVPASRRVYYATDDFAAGASLMGQGRDRFARLEQQRVAQADIVGAVSSHIINRLGVEGRPTFVLPNGCDALRLAHVDRAPRPQDVPVQPPWTTPGAVVGMVGQLSPRVDLGLLEAIADAGLPLLIVGPRHAGFEPARVDRLLARPTVCWVGQKSYADLPGYLALLGVGVTPYLEDEFNAASFPLKTLEYLAAGRPAVSTPLPAVVSLDCPDIRTGRTPAEFVHEVRESLVGARDPAAVERRRRFARGHDWSVRARDFLQVVGRSSDQEAGRAG